MKRVFTPWFHAQQQCRQSFSSYRFIDKTVVEVNGGRGGNGCVSFYEPAPGRKQPTGGNGGKGGNVYIIADKSLKSLNFDTHQFKGGDGRNGGSEQMAGRAGKDTYIRVPVGTVVMERTMTDDSFAADWERMLQERAEILGLSPSTDPHVTINNDSNDDDDNDDEIWKDESVTVTESETEINQSKTKDLSLDSNSSAQVSVENENDDDDDDDDDEEEDDDSDSDGETIVADLDRHNARVLVARGGQFGIGNGNFPRSQRHRKSIPKNAIPGQPGEKRMLTLELKTIADVGKNLHFITIATVQTSNHNNKILLLTY